MLDNTSIIKITLSSMLSASLVKEITHLSRITSRETELWYRHEILCVSVKSIASTWHVHVTDY